MTAKPFLKLAVIGDPVAHSKSPELHRGFLAEAGLDGSYDAVRVPLETLGEALASLAREGYCGLNVTTPLKEAVLQYADVIDESAACINAANTLTRDLQNKYWIAASTDGTGASTALEQALQTSLTGKRILILGVGATGRAAISACTQQHADVVIWNRSQEKAHVIAARFGATVWKTQDADQDTDFDAVLSTLPPDAQLPDEMLPVLAGANVVLDANYSVRATLGTLFHRPILTGEVMLAAQARASFCIWTRTLLTS